MTDKEAERMDSKEAIKRIVDNRRKQKRILVTIPSYREYLKRRQGINTAEICDNGK